MRFNETCQNFQVCCQVILVDQGRYTISDMANQYHVILVLGEVVNDPVGGGNLFTDQTFKLLTLVGAMDSGSN